MGLTVRQYQAADALEIIKGRAKQPAVELDEMTKQLAKRKEQSGPAATCTNGHRIIGCGGLVIIWPGMAEAWCLVVKDIGNYRMAPRIARRLLDKWIKEHSLVRVQAPLRADFPEGERFAKFLGFEREGYLRKYHPDGSDGSMCSIIIDRVKSGE